MRKNYACQKAVPARQWRTGQNRRVGPESGRNSDVDVAPLTRAQMRELDRRIKDSNDRTRYLLVSVMTPRFLLYYNVSEDSYGHNDPRYGTLFKRRHAAEAVRQRANLVLSLGEMTWPHLLVRALLAEQLYRAETILAGHPYHRG